MTDRGNLVATGLLALVIALAGVATVRAEDKPVVAKLAAFVKDADSENWAPLAADAAVDPGAIIEYRVSHTNRSGSSLEGFVVRGPIPDGTSYVGESAHSAAPAELEVLIPGEDWQTHPGKKTVTNDAGEKLRVPAGPDDYTAVRWRLNGAVDDGTTVQNTYRVMVRR